ncbi:hypothetical protein [Janthinobacterium sp. RB2P8]|uniref:hypothetical protein n=1 Tax=Janthinobacterium sp. RB2P8 TaxID=3424191 RepID=UPI003F23C8C0
MLAARRRGLRAPPWRAANGPATSFSTPVSDRWGATAQLLLAVEIGLPRGLVVSLGKLW